MKKVLLGVFLGFLSAVLLDCALGFWMSMLSPFLMLLLMAYMWVTGQNWPH